MISTKRQIRRDDDRYGGFGTGNQSALISDYDIMNNQSMYIGNSMLRTDNDSSAVNPAALADDRVDQPSAMDIAEREPAPQKTEVPAPEATRTQKTETPHSREDVLPTLKTRSYATERAEVINEPAAAEKTDVAKSVHRKLGSREKIMLCVYLVVALALAVAVIATGVSISSAAVRSDELAAQIEQKQIVIAAQETELAILGNEDNIRGRATEFGMVQAGESVYDAPVAEKTGYPQATPRTNGFDEFLDWLSRVLN